MAESQPETMDAPGYTANPVAMYQKMLLIRILEEELQKLCLTGEAGDLHFNKGQEAIAVGACAALLDTDYIVVHHRTIAHAIAKGVPLQPLVAEILGKSTGVCGGRAGEMHLRYPPVRFMFSFQLVGTCVPVAAGLAWAAKHYLKTRDIVAVFHGDAATSNGQWHEGLNIAAVNRLPLLLLCENNELAGNIRSSFYMPVSSVATRASGGYGIESNMVNGNHADEVYEAVRVASKYVREKSRPYLIEFNTTRLSWHKQGQRDVRPAHELAELAERDPLSYEEKRLDLAGALRDSYVTYAAQRVAAAIAKARADPTPSS